MIQSLRLCAFVSSLGSLLVAQDFAEGEPTTRQIDRRFAYTQETMHGAPVHHHELEQWVDWKTHTDNDSNFDRFDFKTELEYGLSERVLLGVDLAEWHWEDSGNERHTRFDASAVEAKFRILDPRRDLVGLAYKTEVAVGPVGLEWENIAIVDKVIDRWLFGYNLKVESGWSGDKLFSFKDAEGEIAQYAGVSYELEPSWFVGTEMVHEMPLPDWKTGADQNLYVGPNVAFHGHQWALTTSALFLATGGDDEPFFQLRVVFEFDF